MFPEVRFEEAFSVCCNLGHTSLTPKFQHIPGITYSSFSCSRYVTSLLLPVVAQRFSLLPKTASKEFLTGYSV